jgi:hypothetical protein
MLEKIKEIIDKNIIINRHSDFQIEKFIIGKELTPSAQAWQCIRELKSRYENLVNLNLEIENVLDDIEIKKIEIEEEKKENTKKTPFIVRKLERSLNSLQTNHSKLLENKKNYEEECEKLLNLFLNIEKNNKILSWNDSEAQAQYFENKFRNEMNLDFLLGHPVNKELVRSILQLDNSSKLKNNLIELIDNRKGLLDNGKQNKQL